MKKLYRKFDIQKTNGEPVDTFAQYFVLRIDTDHASRVALLAYADVMEQDEPELAGQLRLWVHVYEERAEKAEEMAEFADQLRLWAGVHEEQAEEMF